MLRLSPQRGGRVRDLLVVLLGLTVVAGVACLDYAAGAKLLLSIFYLLPVMFVAWSTESTECGLVVAAVSCAVGPVEALMTSFQYVTLPVAIWNAAVRAGCRNSVTR